MSSILENLNQERRSTFIAYYNEKESLSDASIQNWTQHKIYTLITFPANVLKMGISLLGAAAGICTIGAAKIAIYSITLGNVRMHISTGAISFANQGHRAICEIFSTFWELGSDVFNIFQKVASLVKKTINFLGLNHVYQRIKELAHQAFKVIAKRIHEGFEKIEKREANFCLSNRTTPFFTLLNTQREKWAQLETDGSRLWKNIIAHSLFSLINIPVNILAFSCSFIALNILTSLAIGKLMFYTVTKIEIPLPTFVPLFFMCTIRSGDHLLQNGAKCFEDTAISLYKISEATGIYRALVAIKDVITYIPIALFETTSESST